MKMKRIIAITMVAAVFLLAAAAQAFNGTWTNLTSGLNWSTVGNWTNGIVATGSTYTALFNTLDITTDMTVNLDTSRTIGNLIFNDTNQSTPGSWRLTNSASTLTLAGGTPTITVTLAAGKNVTIDNRIAGADGLVKNGTGTLILTTNSTYTGNTVISNGTLQITPVGGIALSSTNVMVKNGSTFAVSGGTFVGATLITNTLLTVQSNGVLQLDKYLFGRYGKFDTGALVSGTNTLYFASTNSATTNTLTIGSVNFTNASVTMRPDNSINPVQTLMFDGTGSGASIDKLLLLAGSSGSSTGFHNYIMNISNSVTAANDLTVTTLNMTAGTNSTTSTFTKQGAGALRVSNDFSAGATNFDMSVSAGTMIFGGTANFKSITVATPGTLQFDSTNACTNSTVISGSGSVVKSGVGTLTLTGTNTYTGATTVQNGTLIGATGGGCTGSAVSVGSAATLSIAVTDTAKQWTCAGLTVTNAGSILDFDFGWLVPGRTVPPLRITGTAALAVTAAVTVKIGNTVDPAGTQYPLMTWNSGTVSAPATVTLIRNGLISAAHLTVSGSTLYLVTDINKALPAQAFSNVKDYGFMWWINETRISSNSWRIKTSRYALSFAYRDLNLNAIFPLAAPVSEAVAQTESETNSFPASAPVSISTCTLIASGVTNTLVACSTSSVNNAQFIEAGQFFQHRWDKIRTTNGPTGLNTNQSGVEVCAWPDRVSIMYRVVPTNSVTSGSLDFKLKLGAAYKTLVTNGVNKALKAADGSGYIVFGRAGSTLSINTNDPSLTIHTDGGTWNADEERSVGLILYPVTNVTAATIAGTAAMETPPGLTANQIAPVAEPNATTYDADRGCYVINIKNYDGWDEDRFERILITLTNATASDRTVRLDFARTNGLWPGAVGTVMILRDLNGTPVGIPVQLSKNWHHATEDRWIGPWFHGLTILTVPASSTLSFEADTMTQNYGGVPAASHAQLCLVGYGDNTQQWEESAIGCWNENLCYDPNRNSIGTDSRPLMLYGIDNWGTNRWTGGNVGGCDFLNYTNGAGIRQYHSRIRTWYKRYGPNLTDVIHAGKTADSKIEFTYSAGLYRSRDYTRGLHRIRYDVTTDTDFKRMVFFQMGADSYNFNSSTNMAYGYGTQITPVLQWTNSNQTTPIQLTNSTPWFSTIDAPIAVKIDDGVTNYYRPANRGFIIRSWKARIHGVDNVKPWFVSTGNRVNLVPPAGVTNLLAGDYVEAEIERVYLPKAGDDYAGSDAHLRTALGSYSNTHSMVVREAIGNNLAVNVQAGSLLHTYPLEIGVTNDYALFSVTGGLGYVSVTFSGVSDYRNPLIEEWNGTSWTVVDQSVFGNDFWQTDYNSTNLSWDITYNLPLGSSGYQDIPALQTTPVTRTFRFQRLSDVAVGPNDCIWTNLASSQNWGTGGNWLYGDIADDNGETANFNTLNITDDTIVHLNSSYTISNLVFGDTATGTAGGWTLDNTGNAANILTLAGSAPAITVNALGTGKNAIISTKLAGTAGLVKNGSGTLILTTNSTYTGNTMISNGTLQIAPCGGVSLVSTNVTVANGGTFAVSGGTGNGISLTANTMLTVQSNGVLQLDKYLAGRFGVFKTGASVSGTDLLYFMATNSPTTKTLTIGSVNFTNGTANSSVILRPDSTVNPVQAIIFDGIGNGSFMTALTFQPGNAGSSSGAHNYIMDISNSVTAANDLTVGTLTMTAAASATTSTFTKQGAGTVRVNNNLAAGATNFDLKVEEGTMIFGGAADFKSMTVSNSGTLQLDRAGSYTNNGVISGSGSLTKSGSGTLTLTTNSTYTGNTLISGGTLNLSSGSPAFPVVLASKNVTVGNGGTLAITGGSMTGAKMADNSLLTVQSNGTLQLDKPLVAQYGKFETGAVVSGTNLLYFIATNAATTNTLMIGSVNFPGAGVVLRPDDSTNPVQTLMFDGTGSGASIDTLYLQAGLNELSTGTNNYIMNISNSVTAVHDLKVGTLYVSGLDTRTNIVTKQGLGTLLVSSNVTGLPRYFEMNIEAGTMIFDGLAKFKIIDVGPAGTLQFGGNGTNNSTVITRGTVRGSNSTGRIVLDDANFEAHEGTVMIDAEVTAGVNAPTRFTVFENQAQITFKSLNQASALYGTFEFIFGTTDISPIQVTNWMNLAQAMIVVDGSSYTGSAGVFTLFNSTNLVAPAASGNITITNFNPSLMAFMKQDQISGDVQLVLVPTTEVQTDVLDLGELTNIPATNDATGYTEGYVATDTLKAIYYDALDWKGSPTKVFAWLGLPANRTGKVPGIVLVHGGGGTAYKQWVTNWTARGFAAISIAVEGQTDVDINLDPTVIEWQQHAWAGPKRIGIYADSMEPLDEQWMYHAAADTILANSLLRSLPEVDADKVGVMGISWGGVIASTVMGIDGRFAFAIPTYGCGHMFDAGNQWETALVSNRLYREVWDPMIRMSRANMPALWLSWPQDQHFPPKCLAATYRAAPGLHMVSLIPGMGHSHPAAWDKPDTYAFAAGIVKDGQPWCRQISSQITPDRVVSVVFSTTNTLSGPMLISTTNPVTTNAWVLSSALMTQNGNNWTLTATNPAGTVAWMLNASNGVLTVSSEPPQGTYARKVSTGNWSVVTQWQDNVSGTYVTSTVLPGSCDTAVINNNAVVDLDAGGGAVKLLQIVNNGTSGTLNVNSENTLSAAVLNIGVLSTGTGVLNQTAGTVSAVTTTVGRATGNPGTYNLSGGMFDMNGTLTINSNGLLNINGGTLFSLYDAGTRTINGAGTLSMSSGIISLCGSQADLNGAHLEVRGGEVDLEAQVRVGAGTDAEFKVVGNAASIAFDSLDQQSASNGTFRFVFGTANISTIHVTDWMNLTNAHVVVDGALYTGSGGTFTLFDSTNLVSPAKPANITVTGFGAKQVSVVQDQADGKDWVQLVVDP